MIRLSHIVFVAWAALAGSIVSCGTAAESISVDTGVTYQTMIGWEATARSWEINKNANGYDPTWLTHHRAVAERMVNELGINRLQLPLKTGWMNPVDYWTRFVNGELTYQQWGQHSYEKIAGAPYQFAEFDFNVESMLLPMREQLEARGERLYVNMIGTDFNSSLNGNFAFSRDPAAYAAFVRAYAERLRTRYGVTLDAFEVTLEPENTNPAHPWSGERIGHALVALRSMFAAIGYPDIDLIAPSVTDASNTIPYMRGIEAVPGALAALTTVAYHRYRPGDYAAIHAFAQARGKRTAMSEWYPANIDTVFDDLLLGQVSSWQKWSVAGRKGGSLNGYYVADLTDPTKPVFTFAPNVAPMAVLFRYVRLGARRVAAASSTMTPIAFVNQDGTTVVVTRRRSGGSKLVTLTGLPPGPYGVRTIAPGAARPTDLPDVTVAPDGSVALTFPEGYTTLYGKSPSAPPPSAKVALVEYRHPAWDHFFLTGNGDEIAQLDSGAFAGWTRTGLQFNGHPAGDPVGSSVCRFFSAAFAPRSSHFYTALSPECAIVSENPDWLWEGVAFNIALPDAAGACEEGSIPVFRLYNDGQGAAPNHRYTTDAGVRDEMIARGWVPEGFGLAGVAMCAPE